MIELLAAALVLLVLIGLFAALLVVRWPKDGVVLALRLAFAVVGLLILLAVALSAYAYDRNVLSALFYPQTQQAPSKP